MYHQFGDPSQTVINYSDLSLMGSNSSNNSFSHDQDLNLLHRQFGGFDAMQGSNYQHCFDSTTSNTSAIFRMLTPGNFQDGFFGEIPADSVSAAASAILYDPSLGLDLGNNKSYVVREVFDHSVLPHGLDGCGGQLVESPQLGNRRQLVGGIRGVEEGAGSLKNEKQRRERLTKKYEVLKSLIPNPTKPDRATIIADTIDYTNELLRTVNELKLLVEKKQQEGSKKLEITGEKVAGDMESSSMKPLHDFKGSLRSSWLQRKSKETHVDVRIVEDEVFIKLTQHKKMDCLLVVSRVLDELELELLHLSGGNIGDLHIFMFNTKIHEGSSVYASAIAKKIIEVMDINYPAC